MIAHNTTVIIEQGLAIPLYNNNYYLLKGIRHLHYFLGTSCIVSLPQRYTQSIIHYKYITFFWIFIQLRYFGVIDRLLKLHLSHRCDVSLF